MDYSKLCESIFNLNSDIRYVAVIDDTGLPVVGGMRGGLDSIMDENNEELYLTITWADQDLLMLKERRYLFLRFIWISISYL